MNQRARVRRFFVLIFLIALPFNARAQETSYIAAIDLPPQLLPGPYTEGSTPFIADVEEILDLQKNLSAADRAAIVNEQHLRLGLITNVMGQAFTPATHPKTFKLLNRVFETSESVVAEDKQFWGVKRPYLVDPRVHLLVAPIDDSPSYPSGHTATSRVTAEVLAMLYPDLADALRVRSRDIASHRIEAGVHYPHDIEAGNLLAMLIVGALTQCRAFNDDLAVARIEVSRLAR